MTLGVKPYQGVDLAFEIPKVRGGLLLWEIIGRMQTKINSLTSATSSAWDSSAMGSVVGSVLTSGRIA